MRGEGGIVCKEYLSDEHWVHLCLCSETRYDEQVAVSSGVEEDTIF